MKTIKSILVAVSVFVLLSAVSAFGQVRRNSVISNPQLAKQIRHELVTLPYYGVFDNLAYNINGSTVTLYGEVVRTTTQSRAEKRVRQVAGVSRVVNQIKVLPLSRFDDNIRAATL